MLKRDRQIRTVIHQLADASLFAIAFLAGVCVARQSRHYRVVEAGAASPFEISRGSISC